MIKEVRMGRFVKKFSVFIVLVACLFSFPILANAESVGGAFRAGSQYDLNQMIIKESVNDYAEIFSADDKTNMQEAISEMIDADTFNLMIITVGNLHGKDIDKFAKEILIKKFGEIPDRVILYVFSLDDRKYTFYLGKSVSEQVPKAFLDYLGKKSVTDFFSKGEYSKGILDMVLRFSDAIINGSDMLTQEKLQMSNAEQGFDLSKISLFMRVAIVTIFALMLLIVIVNLLSLKKSYDDLSNRPVHDDSEYFSAANLASALFAKEFERTGGYNKEV